MDYLYFHSGEVPKYLNYSIDSVLKNDPNSKVTLICDKNFKKSNIVILNINDLGSHFVKEFLELKYFLNFNKNPLWEASILRIFYLLEAAKKLNINNFVHFDSDVILYQPYDKLKNLFQDKLNITPLTNSFLVFGYSFIGNLINFERICYELLKIYKLSDYYEKKYYNGKKIIEMKALYIVYNENPQLVNLLPVHPKDSKDFIFDPASYGQYIGGTHKKYFSKKFTDPKHLLGADLKNKKLILNLEKDFQNVIYNQNNYKLVNLHVHSKKLKKYSNF